MLLDPEAADVAVSAAAQCPPPAAARRVRPVVVGPDRAGVTAIVLCIAIFGPFFAPHSPDELAGGSFVSPSSDHPFGTDFLGRDVLSRVLWGGRSVVGWRSRRPCSHT